MTLTRVERWDAERDGRLSEAALRTKMEALGFVIKARTYPAAIAGTGAVDGVPRAIGVVRGLVRITTDGEQTLLTAGDVAFVPGHATRSVELVGPSTALCLEAIERSGTAGSGPGPASPC